jgi:hypothetical protein
MLTRINITSLSLLSKAFFILQNHLILYILFLEYLSTYYISYLITIVVSVLFDTFKGCPNLATANNSFESLYNPTVVI